MNHGSSSLDVIGATSCFDVRRIRIWSFTTAI